MLREILIKYENKSYSLTEYPYKELHVYTTTFFDDLDSLITYITRRNLKADKINYNNLSDHIINILKKCFLNYYTLAKNIIFINYYNNTGYELAYASSLIHYITTYATLKQLLDKLRLIEDFSNIKVIIESDLESNEIKLHKLVTNEFKILVISSDLSHEDKDYINMVLGT